MTAQQTAPVWADTLRAEQLIESARKLHDNDQQDAALANAFAAFDIYLHLYGEKHVKTARARLFIARQYREINCDNDAMALIRESLRSYEAAKDTYYIAICHNQIGLCLRALYQYKEARQHVNRAIKLLQPDSSRYASTLAMVYFTAGSLYIQESNYQAAIPVFESVIAVFKNLKHKRAVAEANFHLGNAYYGLFDYERAREHYLIALDILKKEIGPEHSYFADLNVKLAYCCQKLGEPETGLQLMLAAKHSYLKAGKEDLNYIQFLQYLGRYYFNAHQYEAAIEPATLCLEAKERRFGVGSYNLLGTLHVLGNTYSKAGRYQDAEAVYRRGLRIAAESLDDDQETACHFYTELAALKLAQGDYISCEQRCDTAFRLSPDGPVHPENVVSREHFRELHHIYAQCLAAQYRLAPDTVLLVRAEQRFALAAEMLYREVQEISVGDSREDFYDNNHSLLEQWLDTRMQMYAATGLPRDAEAAFRISRQSRAFLLSEAMRNSGALRYAGVPDSVLLQERSLRERIASAEKTLDVLGFGNDTLTTGDYFRFNKELSAWRWEYDVLLNRIATTYPDYFRLRLLRQDLSIGELRRKALAPDQALLMYSWTDAGLYAFVLTQDTFCARMLPVGETFSADLEKFTVSLTAYHTAADPNDALYDRSLEQYIALGQSIYRTLLLPLAGLLPERVVLIPDGKLCYLPFEALLTAPPRDAGNFGTYPFWLREKAVSYALSPGLLAETPTAQQRMPVKTWLGLAPFSGNSQPDQIVSRAADGGILPALPYSGKEVTAIAALLNGEVWLGEKARPGRFQAEADRYRILHLATHSRADDRQGNYSYIFTAPEGNPMPAKDLFQYALSADMVVLSACEAGGGKLLRGEGIIGLVRAFLYAGAKSVVASQWVANDQSTSELMVGFYRNLLKGMPKDAALQLARIETIRQYPAQAHPFYWAGFRIFGKVSPVFNGVR